MAKKYIYFLWVLPLLAAACAGLANPFAGDSTGFLPDSGEYPTLVTVGKRTVLFSGSDKEKYLGKERAKFFEQHGLRTVFTRDYTLAGQQLTLESFQLDSDSGASGIYYYYAGRQLRGVGKDVAVGAQAVLDTLNKNRNLYFYKGRWFFSIIYTDKEPAPDLLPLAGFLVARVPGESKRPDGFQYLEVEGISAKYAKVTSGNALNFDIFPPGVYAVAPAGGARAAVYVIDGGERDRAEDRARDFQRYLQVNAAGYRSVRQVFGKDGVVFHQAQDARHGKLVFAHYYRHVLVAAQLDDYAAGQELLSRVIEKMRTVKAAARNK